MSLSSRERATAENIVADTLEVMLKDFSVTFNVGNETTEDINERFEYLVAEIMEELVEPWHRENK